MLFMNPDVLAISFSNSDTEYFEIIASASEYHVLVRIRSKNFDFAPGIVATFISNRYFKISLFFHEVLV